MSFQDHFSGHAAQYAAARPRYPAELFAWAAALPARRRLAVDCATGSGQAALGLAEHFERVVGLDASAEQLSHAAPHPRVEYRVAPAEDTGLPAGAVDLVTAAAGAHWFDFDRFYPEVERLLAPGGAVALWTYDVVRVSPAVDALVHRLAREIVAPYWPPERRWVDERYRTLPFPFEEVEPPRFEIEERWDLDRFAAYLGTWSASKRYERARGRSPVEEIRPELEAAWGDPAAPRSARWELDVRAGRPRPAA